MIAWDDDTQVADVPIRPPARAPMSRRTDDAVPRYILPERTRPYFFPPTRVVITTTSWGG